MSEIPETFMDYVEHHERVWGHDAYTNRPKLQQILDAPIVVFWQDIGPENLQNRRFHVTLHNLLDEVEDFISKALQRTHTEMLEERIHRIFKNGIRIKIKRIRIEFEEANSQETHIRDRQDDNE
jgi:hypothetical protein